jgi:hypothetical protein
MNAKVLGNCQGILSRAHLDPCVLKTSVFRFMMGQLDNVLQQITNSTKNPWHIAHSFDSAIPASTGRGLQHDCIFNNIQANLLVELNRIFVFSADPRCVCHIAAALHLLGYANSAAVTIISSILGV